MTVSSNYTNAYSSYSSSAASSTKQTDRPSFEDLAKKLLSSMDTDKSGSIDSAEFSAAAQALASSSSSSDSSTSSSSTTSSSSVTDAFNALDTNSDGSLSTDELMAALKNTKPQGHEGGMPPPPPPPPSDSSSASSSTSSSSDIFSALDTNQDGSISADELAALFSDTANSSNTASTSTTASSSSQKLSDFMLKNILSYYGNNTSSTDTTSLLSISA